ncbi:DUF2975 domain-containing protein [Listeria booriae]|uniref:DUF2975 domain-containing protein n=1 Tax=Listeria booriae TaxID=1552123 RepID=A0A7X0ZX35_9LIST|nr:DUF2975 domain-containing protein [Listeria booriae]MBC2312154.1 DUF2975 domain-containing protein [Listeria booriae]
MKYGSTIILRIAVILIGLVVLALCIVAVPALAINTTIHNPSFAKSLYPVLIGMCLAAIPFFIALSHTWRLLKYIDNGNAFSTLAVTALKKIKYCALGVAGVYLLTSPFFYMLAQKDDAPGIVVICLLFMGASLVIAIFAAVLQRLLQEAIAIKTENDLTV